MQNAVASGMTGLSCTDEQCRWNAGTRKNLQQKRISQMTFRHHKAEDVYSASSTREGERLPSTPSYDTHHDFRERVSSSDTKPLFELKNSLLEKCYNANVSVLGDDTDSLELHQPHGETLTCSKCKTFYNKYIELNSDQAAELEIQTQNQSLSEVWHSARQIRITASSAKRVPVRATTNPEKFMREHLFPTFRGNAATKYGSEKEAIARSLLVEKGLQVSHSGIRVSLTEPWLSASPDGVVNGMELLEIKCPVPKNTNTSLSDHFTMNNSDIKVVDGKPELQRNGVRGYYRQIQLGMFCTGLRMAKLLVWSPKEHILINVPYDAEYSTHQVTHLRGFYFSVMLPRVVDEFSARRFKLNDKYLHVVKKA